MARRPYRTPEPDHSRWPVHLSRPKITYTGSSRGVRISRRGTSRVPQFVDMQADLAAPHRTSAYAAEPEDIRARWAVSASAAKPSHRDSTTTPPRGTRILVAAAQLRLRQRRSAGRRVPEMGTRRAAGADRPANCRACPRGSSCGRRRLMVGQGGVKARRRQRGLHHQTPEARPHAGTAERKGGNRIRERPRAASPAARNGPAASLIDPATEVPVGRAFGEPPNSTRSGVDIKPEGSSPIAAGGIAARRRVPLVMSAPDVRLY